MLVDDFEFVAMTDVLGEVDVVAEDSGQIADLLVGQAGPLGGDRQVAGDHAMGISLAHDRLVGFALERETCGRTAQADGFQVAELGVQALQLAVRAKFEFEHLTVAQLAELAGLGVAGHYFSDCRGGQADFLKQRGQRIAFGNYDLAVGRARSSGFAGCCSGVGLFGIRGIDVGLLILSLAFGVGGFLLVSPLVDIGEGRIGTVFVVGVVGSRAVGFFLELVFRALEVYGHRGLLGLYFTGRKDQQGQAEEGGYAACGQ